MSRTFTDADGEIFEAVNFPYTMPRDMTELKSDLGQSLSFYTSDAPAIIRLIEQAAGLTAKAGVPVEASCPSRFMDGRNEIRCWLLAGHEGDCK